MMLIWTLPFDIIIFQRKKTPQKRRFKYKVLINYLITPHAMRAPPPPNGAGSSEWLSPPT